MKRLLLGAVFSAVAGAAIAADVPAPVYKAPPAAVVSASGWYFSADGAWQSINLPNYALGFHLLSSPNLADRGTLSLGQRVDGYLVRGTIGYFLPGPSSNSIFGANTRLEVGGFFGDASGSANGIIGSAGPAGGVLSQTLDGTRSATGYVCTAGQVCRINGNSSADYSNWQLHAKVAGDYAFGVVRVTPSLAMFGGNVRNDQNMTQVLSLSPTNDVATYNADTSLRWTDLGARAGLDLKVDVTPWATIGIGGWAGFATRRASLSGSDKYDDNIIGVLNGASAIYISNSSVTPFLANLEGGVAFKPLPGLIVRGFAGLNYDSKVPGISAPSFPSFASTSRTPAGISFQSETSYYAGGGLVWAFGPVVP
jgi:hypothetical protein